MKCDEYRALLSAAMDTPPTPEEQQRLRAHLQECEECRAYAEALAELREELQTLSEPPAALHRQVMEGVKREAAAKKLRRLRSWGSLAACLLVILGAGLIRSQSRAEKAAAPMLAYSAAAEEAPAGAFDEAAEEAASDSAFSAPNGLMMLAPAGAPPERDAPMESEPEAVAGVGNSFLPDPETAARSYLSQLRGRDYGDCSLETAETPPPYTPVAEEYEPVGSCTLVVFDKLTVLVDANGVVFGLIE